MPPPTPAPMRLFVGVPLPGEVRRALADVAAPLLADGWRPSHPDTLHLTLRFLGDTPPAQAAGLEAALRAVAARARPFDVRLGPLFGLPRPDRARVAAASVEVGATELRRLAEALESALAALGFAPEARPFRAHLTLARSADRPLAVPAATARASFRADRLVLWQSLLERPHARHVPLAEAVLGAAAVRPG